MNTTTVVDACRICFILYARHSPHGVMVLWIQDQHGYMYYAGVDWRRLAGIRYGVAWEGEHYALIQQMYGTGQRPSPLELGIK